LKAVVCAPTLREHPKHTRVWIWHNSDVRRCSLTRPLVGAKRTCSRAPESGDQHCYDLDGATLFAHACKMGLEGILSKRRDCPYRSGPFQDVGEDQEPGEPGSHGPITFTYLGKSRTFRVCIPANTQVSKLREVVNNWLNRNKEFLILRAGQVVTAALESEYPCR
jgi:hypothetical protein